MTMAETAHLAVRIDLAGNAGKGIDQFSRKLKGLDSSVGRVGQGFGKLSAGITRAGLLVGGAAVTGLTAAAKAAIDFEDAFAGIRKTVDESDLKAAGLSFESLSKSIRSMATEIPIAATEFARIGETAGALGVKATDIESFTKTVALLGVTTNLTSDEAADALGRLGTILQFTGKDYVDFADSLVALGNTGASTESEIIEISKRFAAEGRAAGLAADEIAGLASVAATLAQPERAGTGLARVFANLGTNISLANAKGKALAKTIGRPIKDLQKDLNKGKGLDIFLDVLGEIRDMPPTKANQVLAALGVTSQTDRSILRNFAELLPEVNRQLDVARDATGSLSEEATKRFDTIASKIQVLKNNLVEAGITIGTGMLPAIGRATKKLTEFLKLPSTQKDLKKLGKDIGAMLERIDWDAVIRGAKAFGAVLKTSVDFVSKLVGALNTLPTEVKGALAGLLVLNKLSDGLLGSGASDIVTGVVTGVTKNLGSMLPGAGRLFTQPVYVTNFPPGFGTGAPGAPLPGVPLPALPPGTVVPRIGAGVAFDPKDFDRALQHVLDERHDRFPETNPNRSDEQKQELKRIGGLQERTKEAQEQIRLAVEREAVIARTEAARNTGTITSAIRAARPTVITDVVVNVTGSGIEKKVTEQVRYGDGNGSHGRYVGAHDGGIH